MVWSDFELDSTRTKFIDENPGGRATMAHEEDQGASGLWSSIGALRGSIGADRSS